MIHSPIPGQSIIDALIRGAGSTAAGQAIHDAQAAHAGGGSSIPGQYVIDAHWTSAGSAAAGRKLIDAHDLNAGGGSSLEAAP
jgi:hypothetical protein